MNKDDFAKRYFQFWLIFHPGKKLTDEVIETAEILYDKFSKTKISLEIINEILASIEDEWLDWPFEFNLYAHVLNWIKANKLNNLISEESFMRKPIKLSREKLFDPNQEKLIKNHDERDEVLKKMLPNWLSLARKIHEKCISYEAEALGHNCWSCMDTGWVMLDTGFAATCLCHKGQRIRRLDGKKVICDGKKVVKEASIVECKEAAIRNGAPVGYEWNIEQSQVPF